jgi:hypothetical protein
MTRYRRFFICEFLKLIPAKLWWAGAAVANDRRGSAQRLFFSSAAITKGRLIFA